MRNTPTTAQSPPTPSRSAPRFAAATLHAVAAIALFPLAILVLYAGLMSAELGNNCSPADGGFVCSGQAATWALFTFPPSSAVVAGLALTMLLARSRRTAAWCFLTATLITAGCLTYMHYVSTLVP